MLPVVIAGAAAAGAAAWDWLKTDQAEKDRAGEIPPVGGDVFSVFPFALQRETARLLLEETDAVKLREAASILDDSGFFLAAARLREKASLFPARVAPKKAEQEVVQPGYGTPIVPMNMKATPIQNPLVSGV